MLHVQAFASNADFRQQRDWMARMMDQKCDQIACDPCNRCCVAPLHTGQHIARCTLQAAVQKQAECDAPDREQDIDVSGAGILALVWERGA